MARAYPSRKEVKMKLRRVYRRGFSQTRNRVIRGGIWNNYASILRAADRYNNSPSYQYNYIGARLYRAKGG